MNAAIARLRLHLEAQLGDAVGGPRQHVFGEDSAAYAELEVRRGEAFALVVVIGSLPSEQFVVDVWQRHTPEVWLVDVSDDTVYIARGDAVARFTAGDVLRSPHLPGVAIPVAAIFGVAN